MRRLAGSRESGTGRVWRGRKLFRAQYWPTKLVKADPSNANLCEANLAEADLREARLGGVDLTAANVYGADFRGCAISEDWSRHLEQSDALLTD